MSSKQSNNGVSGYLSSSFPKDPGAGRINALLSLFKRLPMGTIINVTAHLFISYYM